MRSGETKGRIGMSVPRDLFEAAMEARQRAYAPYSGFRVGAAVRDADGQVVGGCNVENASYGLSNCAERTALFRLVAEGGGKAVEMAVVAEGDGVVTPCGACRQVIMELAPDATLWLCHVDGRSVKRSPAELLPEAFRFSRPT
jgi:cytidine deaminase